MDIQQEDVMLGNPFATIIIKRINNAQLLSGRDSCHLHHHLLRPTRSVITAPFRCVHLSNKTNAIGRK
jgi:hypothetical protein